MSSIHNYNVNKRSSADDSASQTRAKGERVAEVNIKDQIETSTSQLVKAGDYAAAAKLQTSPAPSAGLQKTQQFRGIILGAGPGGIGVLSAKMFAGEHKEFLKRDGGLLWLDNASHMGSGRLPVYGLSADTGAQTLIKTAYGSEKNPLRKALETPIGKKMIAYGTNCLPLFEGGEWFAAMGQVMHNEIKASGTSRFAPNTGAAAMFRQSDGHYVVLANDGQTFKSNRIIFAMGGTQYRGRITQATVGNSKLPLKDAVKNGEVFMTDDLVQHGAYDRLGSRLFQTHGPDGKVKFVVIGSSHSSGTGILAAIDVLNKFKLDGEITWLYKETPRVKYFSVAEALADGMIGITEERPRKPNEFHVTQDVCPVTGAPFRLAGFCYLGLEMLKGQYALGGRTPDKRIKMERLSPELDVASILESAHVVIPAFGYRPNTVPVFNVDGSRIQLNADQPQGAPALVNAHTEVLKADGTPLDGVYGIGLATGFIPQGDVLGGEPSFKGQTNGLGYYQALYAQEVLKQSGL